MRIVTAAKEMVGVIHSKRGIMVKSESRLKGGGLIKIKKNTYLYYDFFLVCG